MRPSLLCVLSLPLLAQAQTLPATSTQKKAGGVVEEGKLPLRARLDKDTIRAAIAATPAEPDAKRRRLEADTLSGAAHENFAKDFAQARKPDCLHSEGLRNQPTFFLNGFLALPFIAVAKLRGVCR
jgi:hypothetical protein